MIDINELRLLTQEATPGPWKMLPVGDGRQKFAVADSEFLSILTVTDEGDATFGTVYDDADAKFIAAVNPAAISELLDRLEAAESDGLEQARLLGMSGEREAALLAKLEAAEKERDSARKLADSLALALNTSNHERDNLRDKVEAMERQEPVAWLHETRRDSDVVTDAVKHVWGKAVVGALDAYSIPLYLAPGAKGEEK